MPRCDGRVRTLIRRRGLSQRQQLPARDRGPSGPARSEARSRRTLYGSGCDAFDRNLQVRLLLRTTEEPPRHRARQPRELRAGPWCGTHARPCLRQRPSELRRTEAGMRQPGHLRGHLRRRQDVSPPAPTAAVLRRHRARSFQDGVRQGDQRCLACEAVYSSLSGTSSSGPLRIRRVMPVGESHSLGVTTMGLTSMSNSSSARRAAA